jgi:Tfp pilus assembly protein PilO
MSPRFRYRPGALRIQAGAAWERWRQRHRRAGRRLPQCGAVLLALLLSGGIGWLLPYRAAKADLAQLGRQEAALKQAYVRELRGAPQAELAAMRRERAGRRLALLEQHLTGRGEREAVIGEIDAAGLARGLRFTLFKPEAAAGAGRRDRMAVQLQALGTYRDIARFANDLAALPRIVILDPLQLQASAEKDGAAAGLLVLQATASAFQSTQEEPKQDEDDE